MGEARQAPRGGTERPVVILLIALDYGYGREIVRGVRQYLKAHSPWNITTVSGQQAVLRLAVYKPSGVIAMLSDRGMVRDARLLEMPVINVSGRAAADGIPTVLPDNHEVGRIAFQHLRERGYSRFAYVGGEDMVFSSHRLKGFSEAAAAAGCQCDVHIGLDSKLTPWLESLPKPIGLMACSDTFARITLTECLAAGVRVPEDIAIVGVDNDDVMCELSEVPLSSVDPSARDVGYQAARLLAALMRGEAAPKAPVLVRPRGVIARASSDAFAVADPDVAYALQYIAAHACDPMTVKQMLDGVRVSRRTLESRFKELVGRTLHEEVRRAQLQRARELLGGTSMKVSEVAGRCGFRDGKRFTNVFTQVVGEPPVAFRKRFSLATE